MPLPSDTSLDDVKLRILESYKNPGVGRVYQVVLKDGKRIVRLATLLESLGNKTRGFHHYSLKIDSIDRKKSGWSYKPEKSIRLDGTDPDEIEKLYRFLNAAAASWAIVAYHCRRRTSSASPDSSRTYH
jgi:hypothetical protein